MPLGFCSSVHTPPHLWDSWLKLTHPKVGLVVSGWGLSPTVLITLISQLTRNGSALVSVSFTEIQEERRSNFLFITPNSSSRYAPVTLSCLV